MDVMTLITNLIQMVILSFGAYKAVKHMKDKGSTIVLIFFMYAILCYFLADLYYITLEIINPDERIPFGVDSIAEMGECLLMASLLNAVFRENDERLVVEGILCVIYSIAIAVLWILWSGEWTKDILGGFYFGYFICISVFSLKKSHAFKKRSGITLGVLAYVTVALQVLILIMPEDTSEILNITAYIFMFSGTAWLLTVAVIYLVKAIKSDSRDLAKKAVATGFITLIWALNTLYMSGDIMYYVADLTCSLALIIIVYAIITLEEKKPNVIMERRARRS